MLLTRKASSLYRTLGASFLVGLLAAGNHLTSKALASKAPEHPALLATSATHSLTSAQTPGKDLATKDTAELVPSQGLTIMANTAGWQNRHPYSLHAQQDEAALYFLYLVAEPLFLLDFEQQWTCGLCKSFPSFANGQIEILSDPNQPYAMKMQLEFAADRRWSDGKAITGQDLYFSWQVATSLEGDFIGRNFYDRIEHVVVDPKDARRVNIFFREHTYLGEDWQHIFLLPKHLEAKLWEEAEANPQHYLETSHYSSAPLTAGLYSGAYALAHYKGSGLAELREHPFHPLPSGAWRHLNVTPFNRSVAKELREQALLISESLCPHSLCASYQELTHDGLGPRQQVYLGDSNLYEQITLNLRNPILKDKRIRAALAFALDKDRIFAFHHHEVIPAVSFMHPKSPYFTASIPFYSPDITKSLALLQDAEWHVNPASGIREKYGKPLTLSLTINKDPARLQTATYLASQWKKIGVDLQINIQEDPLFYGKTLERMNFDGAILFAWDIPVDNSLHDLFSSYAIPSIRNHYQGQNISGWNNRSVDKIMEQLNLEFNPGVRKGLYEQLQQIYAAEIPAIPVAFYLKKAVATKSLQGFRLTGNQIPSSAFARTWRHSEALPTRDKGKESS